MSGQSVVVTERCACGGEYEPDTDGMGTVIDVCGRCGALPGHGKPIARTIGLHVGLQRGRIVPSVTASNAWKKCPVKDCPGTFDETGTCPCCIRRQKFAEQHKPKATCPICYGQFARRGRQKTCKACAPYAKHLAEDLADVNARVVAGMRG